MAADNSGSFRPSWRGGAGQAPQGAQPVAKKAGVLDTVVQDRCSDFSLFGFLVFRTCDASSHCI